MGTATGSGSVTLASPTKSKSSKTGKSSKIKSVKESVEGISSSCAECEVNSNGELDGVDPELDAVLGKDGDLEGEGLFLAHPGFEP